MAKVNKNLRICAIDPSISSTGIAIMDIIDGAKPQLEIVYKTSLINKKSLKNRFEKKEITFELFKYALDKYIEGIDFVIFEDYSFGSVGYLADAGEQIGLFKHYLWEHKKEFDTVAPATVKRLIGGSGFAKKEIVAEGINKYITNINDIKFNNLDETDAVAIGIAYLIFSRERYEPKIAKRRENKIRNRTGRPVNKVRKSKR